ncbi:MAG: class I SAM-dependent methyltransferase [Candidatus Hodarchaeota archaeon]
MDDKNDLVALNKIAWERVADKFAMREPIHVGAVFEFFCDNLEENARVLDAGCGTGLPFAKYLVDKGFDVLGVDIASRMVELATKNVPGATFREGSITELDFGNVFQGVVCSYVMLQLDPTSFKQAAARLTSALNNGGLLYMSLNEPGPEPFDVDGEVIVEIMGEVMYSRAYTRDEVLDAFRPLSMVLVKFRKKTITSKEFGKEYMMEFVFKKAKDAGKM